MPPDQTLQDNQNSSPQTPGSQQPQQASSNGQPLFQGVGRVTNVGPASISVRAISPDELTDQLGRGGSLSLEVRVNDPKTLQKVQANQLVELNVTLGPTADEQEKMMNDELEAKRQAQRQSLFSPAASSSSVSSSSAPSSSQSSSGSQS